MYLNWRAEAMSKLDTLDSFNVVIRHAVSRHVSSVFVVTGFFKRKYCFIALRCTNVYMNSQLKLFHIPVYMKLLT
jgi:hypothetical protein